MASNHKGCAVFNCSNTYYNVKDKKNLSFFRFPKDPERSRQWVVRCRTENLHKKTVIELNANFLVCGEHFEDFMFMNITNRSSLVHNAVPTIFNFRQSSLVELPKKRKPPAERNHISEKKDFEQNHLEWRKLKLSAVPSLCNLPERVEGSTNFVLSLNQAPKFLKPQTSLHRGTELTDEEILVHFDESQFEKKRKDGKRKLKPNAIPSIYETTRRSRKSMKHNPNCSSNSPDGNSRIPSDAEMICGDEYHHPTVKKRKKNSGSNRWLMASSSSWKPHAKESEEGFDNGDNGCETEATWSNGCSKDSSSNGMASSIRTEPLRSSAGFDRSQTPTIPLEKQMHDKEENLLKEWDTTVRYRQENSLSIRPISTDSTASIRIRGKPRIAGSIDLAPSGAVRFEFPEIDIVNRHDTSLDDTAETVDDDPRGFSYAECPTTGHRTMRLEMNVEGFEPKDITVKSFGGRLTVHGIKYDAHNGKKSTDEFCRKIKLPDGVSSESLRCTFCEHVLVLEAPIRARCSTPDVASAHPLNQPVVLSDENGRYLSLVVELGRLFRPSDVVVKVRGQTICVFADTVENTTFSRMKATLEREFDLPEKIDQKSLRAGCTEDRLLKIVARIREPSDRAIPQKAVRIEIDEGVS